MIVSSINGRLRYRAPWLKQHTLQQAFKDKLHQQPAITQMNMNVSTGSILVNYDTNYISRAALEALIVEIALSLVSSAEARTCPMHTVNESTNKSRTPSQKPSKRPIKAISVNQAIKFGMLGSLIPSMAWAAVGSKKIHILSGGVFLIFVGMHMFSYRKRLLK